MLSLKISSVVENRHKSECLLLVDSFENNTGVCRVDLARNVLDSTDSLTRGCFPEENNGYGS